MILSIFTYLSVVIFAAVVIYRFIKVASTPVHLRWDLYPVPHEGFKKAKYGGSYYEELDWWMKKRRVSKASELSVMIPEILFLKGVWESNKGLWFWSWAFHFGLYLAILTVVLIFSSVVFGTASSFGSLLAGTGARVSMAAYILGVIGCLGMLVKRLTDSKLKPFTAASAIFNLLFILAIFATGLAAILKIGQNEMFAQFQQYASGLIYFESGAAMETIVAWHITITLLFMVYMPFTHMSHFVLKWFTYHHIRWNDEPNTKGSKLEKEIIECLNMKPTWAARHIRADGKKTWVDIATDEVFKDEKK
ncbi:MAG: hypothetical protein GY839_03725 [candidate division Zixibacteria bacterium]|nr:hypothetical protein [candidate division Zixibacteria bacterium]